MGRGERPAAMHSRGIEVTGDVPVTMSLTEDGGPWPEAIW